MNEWIFYGNFFKLLPPSRIKSICGHPNGSELSLWIWSIIWLFGSSPTVNCHECRVVTNRVEEGVGRWIPSGVLCKQFVAKFLSNYLLVTSVTPTTPLANQNKSNFYFNKVHLILFHLPFCSTNISHLFHRVSIHKLIRLRKDLEIEWVNGFDSSKMSSCVISICGVFFYQHWNDTTNERLEAGNTHQNSRRNTPMTTKQLMIFPSIRFLCPFRNFPFEMSAKNTTHFLFRPFFDELNFYFRQFTEFICDDAATKTPLYDFYFLFFSLLFDNFAFGTFNGGLQNTTHAPNSRTGNNQAITTTVDAMSFPHRRQFPTLLLLPLLLSRNVLFSVLLFVFKLLYFAIIFFFLIFFPVDFHKS